MHDRAIKALLRLRGFHRWRLAWVGLAAGILVTVLLILLSVWLERGGHGADGAAREDAVSWWKFGAGLAVFMASVVGNLLANACQDALDSWPRDALTANHNHHLADVVGESMRVLMLVLAESAPPPPGWSLAEFPFSVTPGARALLVDIAAEVPGFWRYLVTTRSEEVLAEFKGLLEPDLSRFVIDKEAAVMSPASWSRLIERTASWSSQRNGAQERKALSASDVDVTVRMLGAQFGRSFREALKEEGTRDGFGWQAMQLEVGGELLRSAQRSEKQSRELLSATTALQVSLSNKIDELRSSIERQENERRKAHAETLRRIDDLSRSLQAIADDTKEMRRSLHEIEETTGQLRTLLEGIPISHLDPKAERIIAKLATGFIGREWLFQEVADFCRTNAATGGYIMIAGAPGIGKSAIAAKLVAAESALVHFFRRGTVDQDLKSLHKSLWDQATTVLRVDDRQFEAGAPIESLVDAISFSLGTATSRMLVIDGLDEATVESRKAGRNPLGLPSRLAKGVFVVITSREREDCKLQQSDVPVLTIALQSRAENLKDVECYTREYAKLARTRQYLERNSLSEDEFVALLVQKAEGNFMYLRHVLPEVTSGFLSNMAVDALPRSLRDFYALHWASMKVDAAGADLGWKMIVLAVLGATDVGWTPSDLLGITSRTIPILAQARPDLVVQARTSPATEADVAALLDEWSEYLLSVPSPIGETTSKIYHLSFRDFLKEEAIRKVGGLEDAVGLATAANLRAMIVKMRN
jgi:hypothetical protein